MPENLQLVVPDAFLTLYKHVTSFFVTVSWLLMGRLWRTLQRALKCSFDRRIGTEEMIKPLREKARKNFWKGWCNIVGLKMNCPSAEYKICEITFQLAYCIFLCWALCYHIMMQVKLGVIYHEPEEVAARRVKDGWSGWFGSTKAFGWWNLIGWCLISQAEMERHWGQLLKVHWCFPVTNEWTVKVSRMGD